eukprot:scaffold1262_cov106-Cylindrotheca_fusiformis.AAC.7
MSPGVPHCIVHLHVDHWPARIEPPYVPNAVQPYKMLDDCGERSTFFDSIDREAGDQKVEVQPTLRVQKNTRCQHTSTAIK